MGADNMNKKLTEETLAKELYVQQILFEEREPDV